MNRVGKMRTSDTGCHSDKRLSHDCEVDILSHGDLIVFLGLLDSQLCSYILHTQAEDGRDDVSGPGWQVSMP